MLELYNDDGDNDDDGGGDFVARIPLEMSFSSFRRNRRVARSADVSCCRLRNFLSDSRAALTPTGKGDGLDLDGDALGQLLNSHAGASRLVSEVLLVDRVHLGEVVHGGDKDVDL